MVSLAPVKCKLRRLLFRRIEVLMTSIQPHATRPVIVTSR